MIDGPVTMGLALLLLVVMCVAWVFGPKPQQGE